MASPRPEHFPPRVEPLGAGDRRFGADLHRAALAAGLFPSLGPRFLRAYYASFERSPYGIALVAWRNGARVGVLVGTTNDAAHHRWVLRQEGWRLAPLAALGLVRRPALLVRFVRHRARRYLRGAFRLARATPVTGPTGPTAVLSHVAVVAESRGTGAGAALVQTYVERAFASGAGRLTVMTAGDDDVDGFYRALGWDLVGERPDLDGRPYHVLERRAPTAPAPPAPSGRGVDRQ